MVELKKLKQPKAQLITIGFLREELAGYSDDTEITFGDVASGVPREFNRIKKRGHKLIQIELNEVIEEGMSVTLSR